MENPYNTFKQYNEKFLEIYRLLEICRISRVPFLRSD